MDVKRAFDLLLALCLLFLLAPLFIPLAIWIILDSKGAIFYTQDRVGKNKISFRLIKLRTMRTGADRYGLLTVGDRDTRVTRAGYWLRKYKIDELPQLWNILRGDMSFVGPRPEVDKYVSCYSTAQQRVLSIKPGITDWASLEYINESEILATKQDPEAYYKNHIMPRKIEEGLRYIDEKSFLTDLRIIGKTLKSIVQKPHSYR